MFQVPAKHASAMKKGRSRVIARKEEAEYITNVLPSRRDDHLCYFLGLPCCQHNHYCFRSLAELQLQRTYTPHITLGPSTTLHSTTTRWLLSALKRQARRCPVGLPTIRSARSFMSQTRTLSIQRAMLYWSHILLIPTAL